MLIQIGLCLIDHLSEFRSYLTVVAEIEIELVINAVHRNPAPFIEHPRLITRRILDLAM
jgi:hypothetical protein